MKFLKQIIASIFLIGSIWLSYLIFSRIYSYPGMEFSVDSNLENHFMMLLIGTVLSMIGIFFSGLLALFSHFVFVKILFVDDIKSAAFNFLKSKRKHLNINRYKNKEDQSDSTLIKS